MVSDTLRCSTSTQPECSERLASYNLLAAVDGLVAAGVFQSRAAAVRAGLEAIAEAERRRAFDVAVVEGDTRLPPTPSEGAAALASLRDAIADEPW